jgi:glutathione S-transferase
MTNITVTDVTVTDVTVYGVPQSTFVRTARMTLEEKEVPYDLELVQWSDPAYEALHPFRRMPAFRHGDVHLFETLAITEYVDEVFAGPRLQPADAHGRALMNQWISAVNDYVVTDVTRRYIVEYVLRPSGPDGKPDADNIEEALVDVRHHLGVIDRELGKSAYLAGGEVTLADLFLAPITYYVSKMPEGDELFGACPNLARWFAAMSGRASFIATIPPPFPGRSPD